MTTHRIADLQMADLDDALLLNNEAVPALSELDRAALEQLYEMREFALAVRIDDGRLGAFCLTLAPGVDYASLNYRWFCERYDSFSYLDRIVVLPDLRGQGVGEAMYAELERRIAGSVPWLLCEVNVRPMNEGSLRFHHRIGFVEVGQQDTDSGRKTVSLLAKSLHR